MVPRVHHMVFDNCVTASAHAGGSEVFDAKMEMLLAIPRESLEMLEHSTMR